MAQRDSDINNSGSARGRMRDEAKRQRITREQMRPKINSQIVSKAISQRIQGEIEKALFEMGLGNRPKRK